MKVVLTKYHEEVTSVRKSVTQVKVETTERIFDVNGSPVIDVTPEATVIDRPLPTNPAPRFPGQQKQISSGLTARADAITDIVDLHSSSHGDGANRASYSATDAVTGNHLRERIGSEGPPRPRSPSIHERGQNLNVRTGAYLPSMPEGRGDRHDWRIKRFSNAQEIIEHHGRSEKKVTIDIKV